MSPKRGWPQRIIILLAIALAAVSVVATVSADSPSSGLSAPTAAVPGADSGALVADYSNCVVKKLSSGGALTTVAGISPAGNPPTPNCGATGDGGAATSAKLDHPTDAVPTAGGGFLISSVGNGFADCSVRQVAADGTISTVAGNGTCGNSGDGGPATSAAVDADLGGSLQCPRRRRAHARKRLPGHRRLCGAQGRRHDSHHQHSGRQRPLSLKPRFAPSGVVHPRPMRARQLHRLGRTLEQPGRPQPGLEGIAGEPQPRRNDFRRADGLMPLDLLLPGRGWTRRRLRLSQPNGGRSGLDEVDSLGNRGARVGVLRVGEPVRRR